MREIDGVRAAPRGTRMVERVELAQVGEVVAVLPYWSRDTSRINAYLGAGWVLLSVRDADDSQGKPATYMLGWPRALGPLRHPVLPETYAEVFNESWAVLSHHIHHAPLSGESHIPRRQTHRQALLRHAVLRPGQHLAPEFGLRERQGAARAQAEVAADVARGVLLGDDPGERPQAPALEALLLVEHGQA